MKLQDIQRKLGCNLRMALEVQTMIMSVSTCDQTARVLCRSALAELNDALACGNVAHPKIDAAARYLRDALDLMGDSEIETAKLKTSAALRAQDTAFLRQPRHSMDDTSESEAL